ncbi:MAG: hypothetical protein GY849_10535 [Deltaproteobacteria bacterium]|nr:hypothetical protein [Deltaproteobacteria bacterium]
MNENNNPIFRPELSLELYLSASQKRSKLVINDTEDAVEILEGIKDLNSDHSVLIYLDENNVVVEVETYLNAVDQFDAVEANRVLASVIYKQNKDPMIKVVLARTIQDVDEATPDQIDLKKLANLAIRFLWVGVELVDFILIGQNSYFSLKKKKQIWSQYERELEVRKQLSMDESFVPDVIKTLNTEIPNKPDAPDKK